jgi:ABC-type molybdenum transport system ATPase subunit/photorepair protein PhrA
LYNKYLAGGVMKKVVGIENLNFSKDNKVILNNISLDFYQGVDTFICGTSGSGKSSLLKAINGDIKYTGNINKCDNVYVLDDKLSFSNTLVSSLISINKLDDGAKKFVGSFFDNVILESTADKISFREQKLLLIFTTLIHKPKVLFIDNVFSFLNSSDIKKIRTYFKKQKTTLIVVSNNIEDALNYPYMIVMDKGIVAIEGKTMQVLMEEKILKRLGIGLPFYVDLSIQLKLYGLIDDIYLKKKDLRDNLWK